MTAGAEHTGKRKIAEAMDHMTKSNQAMKIAFTTENTFYKAKAHKKLIEKPWYLKVKN